MDALQRVFTEGGGGNKDLQFLSSEDSSLSSLPSVSFY
jgi:hypothetical protein